MIYFDNAATSFPKPESVVRTVDNGLRIYGGNPGRSGHIISLKTAEQIYSVREQAAGLFAAQPENIIFTSNCTHALNIAIQGLTQQGKTVLTTNLEHNSVARPLYALAASKKIKWEQIDVHNKSDDEIVQLFSSHLTSQVCFVVCTHASNVTGQTLPIRKIYALCKNKKIPMIVDAAQTAGVLPVEVGKDADIICTAGHKGLYGPPGTGLMVLNTIYPRPLTHGGTGSESLHLQTPQQPPERYESGTVNTAGILGLGAGIRFVRQRGLTQIHSHEMKLCSYAKEHLAQIPGIRLYEIKNAKVPILSFNFQGVASQVGTQKLSDSGFALRGGLHCAPSAHTALQTLPAGTIRFAPSIFNSARQVNSFCATVEHIQRKLQTTRSGKSR